VTGGSHLNNPFLYSHVPYDPIKDFDPVTLAVELGGGADGAPIGARRKASRSSVALIQSQFRQIQLRVAGHRHAAAIGRALFACRSILDLVHVPFSGGGPAIGSTVAGHTPISFGAMAPAGAAGQGRQATRARGDVKGANSGVA